MNSQGGSDDRPLSVRLERSSIIRIIRAPAERPSPPNPPSQGGETVRGALLVGRPMTSQAGMMMGRSAGAANSTVGAVPRSRNRLRSSVYACWTNLKSYQLLSLIITPDARFGQHTVFRMSFFNKKIGLENCVFRRSRGRVRRCGPQVDDRQSPGFTMVSGGQESPKSARRPGLVAARATATTDPTALEAVGLNT